MENLQLDANKLNHEIKSHRNHASVVLLLTAVLVSLSTLQYLIFFLLTKLSDCLVLAVSLGTDLFFQNLLTFFCTYVGKGT